MMGLPGMARVYFGLEVEDWDSGWGMWCEVCAGVRGLLPRLTNKFF